MLVMVCSKLRFSALQIPSHDPPAGSRADHPRPGLQQGARTAAHTQHHLRPCHRPADTHRLGHQYPLPGGQTQIYGGYIPSNNTGVYLSTLQDPVYTTSSGEMSEIGDPEWLGEFSSAVMSLSHQQFSSQLDTQADTGSVTM